MEMVSRERFFDVTKECVDAVLKDKGLDVELELHKVIKNNDQELMGLHGRIKGSNTAPCIYLDESYERYIHGYPVIQLIDQIAQSMYEALGMKLNIEPYMDYEYAQMHLSIRLVGIEENQQWLEDKLWKPMGDFARVCYLDNRTDIDGRMVSTVPVRAAADWHVSKERVFRDAYRNLKAKKAVLIELSSFEEKRIEELQIAHEETGSPYMYILTNEEKVYGAAMIAREDLLKAIGDQFGCDYYVLPSSVDDVLIIPALKNINLEALIKMHRMANENTVSKMEKLSDEVQYYSREKGKLYNAKKWFFDKGE